MRQALEQAVAAANQLLGYDRIALTWLGDHDARLDTLAERTGNCTSRSRYCLPRDFDKALRAIARITEDYPPKRNASLARHK